MYTQKNIVLTLAPTLNTNKYSETENSEIGRRLLDKKI